MFDQAAMSTHSAVPPRTKSWERRQRYKRQQARIRLLLVADGKRLHDHHSSAVPAMRAQRALKIDDSVCLLVRLVESLILLVEKLERQEKAVAQAKGKEEKTTFKRRRKPT